ILNSLNAPRLGAAFPPHFLVPLWTFPRERSPAVLLPLLLVLDPRNLPISPLSIPNRPASVMTKIPQCPRMLETPQQQGAPSLAVPVAELVPVAVPRPIWKTLLLDPIKCRVHLRRQ